MRVLIIPLLVLLASCGTTHKIITSKKTTSDSSSTVTRDTSHVSQQTSSTDNLNVQNVHIRVEYAADTALAQAKERQPNDSATSYGHDNLGGYGSWSKFTLSRSGEDRIAQGIRDAIAASGGGGRLPESITIDIGSISDSSTHTVKKDSGSSHSTAQTDLKKTESDKSKDVTHTGLSVGLKIGIGFFLLILLAVVAWRLYQKFKPI